MATINLGRIGFVNKGDYNALTAYKVNDIVKYTSGTYACKLAHTGQVPTETTYWQEWVDDNAVHKTGDETVAGTKTFSSSPIVPTPTTGTHAVNKDYADSKYSGFKNYIINGNFDIWQRGNGPFTGHNYGPDRWVCACGIHNSSATSSVIGKRINHITNTTAGGNLLYQAIELNLAGYNAPFTVGKTFTISVYYASTTKIKPSLTFRDGVVGNNPVEIFTTTEYKGGSGNSQVVSWTFTVSATALPTNTCATLSIIGESAATNCYVYNVQLEEGSVATPFEQRPYGLELSLCQRYYQTCRGTIMKHTTSGNHMGTQPITFNFMMRVSPTVSIAKSGIMIGTKALDFGIHSDNLHIFGGEDYFYGNIGDYTGFLCKLSAEL